MDGDTWAEPWSATRSENHPSCCGRHAATNEPSAPIVALPAWVDWEPGWLCCSITSVRPDCADEAVPLSHSRPWSSTPVWLETVIPSPLTVTSWLATAAVVADGVEAGSPIPPVAARGDDGVATANTMSTAAIFRLRDRPIYFWLLGTPTG